MFALESLEKEVKADVDSAVHSFRTISGSGMTALQALLGLRANLAALGVKEPLPRLGVMCEQMVDGWCEEVPEILRTTLDRSLDRDDGKEVAEGVLRTSSAVDVFTQLDRFSQVYATFCQLPPAPLPQRVHQRFLELVEAQVCTYVMRTASTAPLPPSCLQKERRGSALATRQRGGSSEGGSAASKAAGGEQRAHHAQPRAADLRVEATSLHQLCLRLNDCEWSGEQLLQLAARLRADVPGLGRLPGGGVRQCEQSCRDLLDYITARLVYYELEPQLVTNLYLPTPESGPLTDLLPALEPMLRQMRTTVAPRWSQRLLESVLSTTAIAVAAVIELPDRKFTPAHKALLDADVDALGSFFLKEGRGVLEEQVVRHAVSFLYALGAQACSP